MSGTGWVSAQRAATAAAILAAESPAEAAVLVHLLASQTATGYLVGPRGSGADWTLTTQRWVATPGHGYRLDIALERGPHLVAVEVDGWAYHHADDDQEVRDAARDLALRLAGWTVLRIDAWRVFEAPSKCVSDIQALLRAAEAIGAPKQPRPSPNADIMERFEQVKGNAEAENELLRELFQRKREELAQRQIKRPA